jgi:hypothetical protein
LGAKLEWIALSERELEAAELARARDDARFAPWPALLHRLRPAVPWELPGLSPEIALRAWMAIRRIEPGPRVKKVFTPPSPPPDNEAIAHALFDLLEEFERTGASELSIELINARAALLGRSGSA